MGLGDGAEAFPRAAGRAESGSRLRRQGREQGCARSETQRHTSSRASEGSSCVLDRLVNYAALRNGNAFRSWSRKSIVNGGSIGPSPHWPRGGLTALGDAQESLMRAADEDGSGRFRAFAPEH